MLFMIFFTPKNISIPCLLLFVSIMHAQYRWEVSLGPSFSQLQIANTDTSGSLGFYANAGYGYISGVRAKTSIIFSLDMIQRSSKAKVSNQKFSALQIGFNPKFRYLFNGGKDRFRPFINVGPSFRLNTNFKIGDTSLAEDQIEKLVIGGVYGAGFSQMVGELFDILAEVGVLNDFTNNLKSADSKFFDIYLRLGIRFRIYDARR